VEPCPTFYLRTARSYAFLLNFLEAALGKSTLQDIYGLRKEGRRELNLFDELGFMRDLFYGLYFTSLEDLGMSPELAKDEQANTSKTTSLAKNWLLDVPAGKDKDLAALTHAAVPIFVDANRRVTRVWTTLGVRLVRLDASFAVAPRILIGSNKGEWLPVERFNWRTANYLIPVAEFAEVELNGYKMLTRDELKEICDREKTKEAIVKALRTP
jgi:hypothetical protein